MNRKLITLGVALLLFAGAFLILLTPAGTVAGADLYVSPTGSTFTTIQEAINASSDGDTIIIADGNYAENLTFAALTGYAKLTLIGNGSVTIDPPAEDVINVTGANVASVDLVNLTLMNTNALDINATGGAVVSTAGVSFTNLSVDHESELHVYHWITPTCYFLGGVDPVEGADINWTDDSGYQYRTPFYDGADLLTGADGTVGFPFLMKNAAYINDNTSQWANNQIKAWVNVDAMLQVIYPIDTNATGPVPIVFTNDLRAPPKIENLTVTPIDQTSLYLSWNATTETQFDNYTVYSTDEFGSAKTPLGNATNNWYIDPGLLPDTTHYYIVTASDTSGLESADSDVANGTTMPITNGTINGTVLWDAVPAELVLGGERKAVVELLNSTMDVIATTNVNVTEYNFTFDMVDFQTDLYVRATPDAAVRGEVDLASGYMVNTTDPFELNLTNLALTKDLVLDFYTVPSMLRVVSGHVTYQDGPLAGMNATNATLVLFRTDLVINATDNSTSNVTKQIDSVTSDSVTGFYEFEFVLLGMNYTIEVTPNDDDLGAVDAKTGYLPTTTPAFNVTDDMTMNLTLEHYVYIPPLPILAGQVKYGPGNATLSGTNATGAMVRLLNETRAEIASMETHNVTGAYVLIDVPIGVNYTLQVTPAAEVLAQVNAVSGYLVYESDPFDVSANRIMDVELVYYPYVPATPLIIVTGEPEGLDIAIGTDISVLFNYEVDPDEFETAFSIDPAVGGLNFTWAPGGKSVVISHDDLDYETTYVITISLLLESVDDIGFEDGYADNTWQFTTEDTPPPPVPTLSLNDIPVVTVDGSVTISGTSEWMVGETVTVSIEDGDSGTAVIKTDGTWSVKLEIPDEPGTYIVTATAGNLSTTKNLVVEEESEPFFDTGWLEDLILGSTVLTGLCCGGIIVVIIIVILSIVFLISRRKKKAKTVYVDRTVTQYVETEREEPEEEEDEVVDEDEEEVADDEDEVVDEDEEEVTDDEDEVVDEEDEEVADDEDEAAAVGEPVDDDAGEEADEGTGGDEEAVEVDEDDLSGLDLDLEDDDGGAEEEKPSEE